MSSFFLDTNDIPEADSVREPIEILWEALNRSGYISLLREFTDGTTPTRVILAEDKATPVDLQPHHLVFKIGPIDLIRAELERYKAFCQSLRSHAVFAELLDPEATGNALRSDMSLGAIAYQSVADQMAGSSAVSLKDLFSQALQGRIPSETVANVFNSTLQALGMLYAKPKESFAFKIPEYYLERWFPDFRLNVERKVDYKEAGCLLTLHRNDPNAFRGQQLRALRTVAKNPDGRHDIAASNLNFLGIWNNTIGLKLGANPPDQLHLQVDVSALSSKEREALHDEVRPIAIWASASGSRVQFYRQRVEEAFPGVPLDVPVFDASGLRVPNPLRDLSKPLRRLKQDKIRLVPAHGDLHPGNILVVGQTPVIIDYGLAHTELPLGIDAIRLFGCLVRDVLAESVGYSSLLDILPGILGIKKASSLKEGPEQIAHDLLSSLWQGIGRKVGPESATYLPAHLYGFAWIGLKWSGSLVAWQACFLLACLAARLLEGEPADNGPVLRPTAWSLILGKMENDLIGAEVLAVSVFLHPDNIPLELITLGASEFGPTLAAFSQNAENLAGHEVEILELLARNSLVRMSADNNSYSIKRELQGALRDEMGAPDRRLWAERAVRALSLAFPEVKYENWSLCARLLPHLEVAARLTETYDLNLEEGGRLFNLGGFYCHEQQDFKRAEVFYQRALDIRQKILTSDHPDLAASLFNLGLLFYSLNRYAEAESFYKQALEIRGRLLEPEHPDTTLNLDSLARLYEKQGQYEEAEQLYVDSLQRREKVLGKDHLDIATSSNNLAVLYRQQGRYDEAEEHYKRALAIRERNLKSKHPHIATSLNNLGLLYRHQGRYQDAERCYERALKIREEIFGPKHRYVAESLSNLAVLYEFQGRYVDAEPLHERALTIREETLGPEHLAVAESLNNLASLYHNQKHFEAAEAYYKRSLEIRQKHLGTDHPDVACCLENLAKLYKDKGLHSVAELLYKMSLTIREKVLGASHPDVAANIDNLALLYHDQERYDEAEPLLRRAHEIRERTFGQEHLEVAASLNNLAVLYKRRGRYDEAEPLFKRSLEIRKKTLGPEHPDVAASMEYYRKFLEDSHREAKKPDPTRPP